MLTAYRLSRNIHMQETLNHIVGHDYITRWRTEELWLNFWQGQKTFLLKCPGHVWGPSSLLYSVIFKEYWGLSSGIKQYRHEFDDSPPSSDELKNARSYTSTPARVHITLKFLKWENLQVKCKN